MCMKTALARSWLLPIWEQMVAHPEQEHTFGTKLVRALITEEVGERVDDIFRTR